MRWLWDADTAFTGRIDEIQKKAVGTIISQLKSLVEEYRDPHYQCPHGVSFECGSMLYGALSKELELHGLSPFPTAPYTGFSVSELSVKMRKIRSPSWYPQGKKVKHSCSLDWGVMAIVDPVTRLAKGPELKDFNFR